MKTLLTLNNIAANYIVAHRSDYPTLASFDRIISLNHYLYERNQRSDQPFVIANEAQMLEICLNVCGNISQAQYLNGLYALIKNFQLDHHQWQDDPDPIIREQYLNIVALESELNNQKKHHFTQLYHHIKSDNSLTLLDSQTTVPAINMRWVNQKINLNSTSHSTQIHHIDHIMSPNRLSKFIQSNKIRDYLVSGSCSSRLSQLSAHHINHFDQTYPMSLADTHWFKIWNNIWKMPDTLIQTSQIKTLLTSPYIRPETLTHDIIADILAKASKWPSDFIDIEHSAVLAPSLKDLLVKSNALIKNTAFSPSLWFDTHNQLAQLWGISMPEPLDLYHKELSQKWHVWLKNQSSCAQDHSKSEWLEIARLTASQLVIHPCNLSESHYLPISQLAGLRKKDIILFDMDDATWLTNDSKYHLPDNQKATIKNYYNQHRSHIINQIMNDYERIFVIVEPNKHQDLMSSFHNSPIKQSVINTTDNSPTLSRYDPYQSNKFDDSQLKRAAQVIKEYATCPSKGYLIHRLELHPHTQNTTGSDARLRGIIIHEWLSFNKNLDYSERTHFIKKHLANARREGYVIPATVESFEIDRIQNMMSQYTHLLQEHSALDSVSHHEMRVSGSIANLKINCRIDGIINKGKQTIVIDYKTSPHSVVSCITNPLKSPQLPLYTSLIGESVTGICYINIGSSKATLSGATWQQQQELPLKNIDNPSTLWRKEINSVIAQIKDGYSEPTPIDDKECQSCTVANICRKISRRKDHETAS